MIKNNRSIIATFARLIAFANCVGVVIVGLYFAIWWSFVGGLYEMYLGMSPVADTWQLWNGTMRVMACGFIVIATVAAAQFCIYVADAITKWEWKR